jgi:hypothetical protein
MKILTLTLTTPGKNARSRSSSIDERKLSVTKKATVILAIFCFSVQVACASKADSAANSAQATVHCFSVMERQINSTGRLSLLVPGVSNINPVAFAYPGKVYNYSPPRFGAGKKPGLTFIAGLAALTKLHFLIPSGSTSKMAFISIKRATSAANDKGLHALHYTAITLKINL